MSQGRYSTEESFDLINKLNRFLVPGTPGLRMTMPAIPAEFMKMF
jgi:hypothetical protein